MYQIWISSQFKTDIKAYKSKWSTIQKLKTVVSLLGEWISLPREYKDHELKWEFVWVRECHISPDVLLIYEIDNKNNAVRLVRIGSHNKLFW
jgi:mRNA interferase YafQ